MTQKTIISKMVLDKSKLTDKELIEQLKEELKEARIQRNTYEEELILARRKVREQQIIIEQYESYINRTKQLP